MLLLLLTTAVGCGVSEGSASSITPLASAMVLPTTRVSPTAVFRFEASPTVIDTAIPQPQSESPTTPPASPTASSSATPSAFPTFTPTLLPVATATDAPVPTPAMSVEPPAFSYPIGLPGYPLGDGFFIRHGYLAENTWYNPQYWHAGEDWYATDGDTAGARVYAVAGGEVVYVGSNYPGRVVIIRHAEDLFSMYGHLDPAVLVEIGQNVDRGQQIGVVLRRTDQTPNHLHFEMRTFLTTNDVNGAAPLYPFRCGVNCAPGPGYWPFDAPDAGSFGWRNPTHMLAHRGFPQQGTGARGEVAVTTRPVSSTAGLWSEPPQADTSPQLVGEVTLQPGQRFSLLDVAAGPEDTRTTSAQSYWLWYRIQLEDGRSGWVQAGVPSPFETGSDGRPSTISFNFVPANALAP